MKRWRRMAACGMSAALSVVGTTAIVTMATTTAGGQEVPALVEQQLPGLLVTYKGIHEAPELSHHEERTSALLAGELRKAGYTVTERWGGILMGRRRMGWWGY